MRWELALSSLLGASDQVGSGRIQGGWGYVWVSYAITWTTIAVYDLSLYWRRRTLKKQLEQL